MEKGNSDERDSESAWGAGFKADYQTILVEERPFFFGAMLLVLVIIGQMLIGGGLLLLWYALVRFNESTGKFTFI